MYFNWFGCALLLVQSFYYIQAYHKKKTAGYYCKDDLSGYYKLTNGVKEFTACPPNTRCSCYFRQKCTMPLEKVCSKDDFYFPTNRSFTLKFRSVTTQVMNANSSITVRRYGTVKQNFESRTYSSKEIILTPRAFIKSSTIVIPNVNGSFDGVG